MIDIISPLESYSAADFVGDCVRLVNEIHTRGRYPLIVGGTMMYFHALTEGLNDLPGADAEVRAQLQAEKTNAVWQACIAVCRRLTRLRQAV